MAFRKAKKLLIYYKKTPQVGLEPTTNRLTADRSTAELLRHDHNLNFILPNLCYL